MQHWKYAHASVVGTDHAAIGLGCQDSYLIDQVEVDGTSRPVLLVAVADGAGSAVRASDGARLACNHAILSLKENVGGLSAVGATESIRRSVEAARLAIEDFAVLEGCPSESFATTIILVAVGEDWIAWGQVGDGVVVFKDADEFCVGHWPEQESVNITNFITHGDLNTTVVLGSREISVEAVACLTDGLMPLLMDFRSRSPGEQVFSRLFDACRQAPEDGTMDQDLTEFLASDMVNERTSDDKTIVIAVHGELDR